MRFGVLLIVSQTLFFGDGKAIASFNNQVIGWGAGKTINASDERDYGQTIIPGNLTNDPLQVVSGQTFSMALSANGTIEGWGDNSFGESAFPAGSNYVAIACGSIFGVALETNGALVAEGYPAYGETTLPTGLTNVVAVACGWAHGLALKSDGTVIAWGGAAPAPDYGQTTVPSGLSNVVAIAAGGYHSLALTASGTLVEWGDEASWGGTIPTGLSNVVAIATGAQHNVVLLSNGTVEAWGTNTFGPTTNVPAGLSNVVAIAAGSWHTLALKSDGTVVAWGAGSGTNAIADYRQNIVPAGLTNVVQIAAGFVDSLVVQGEGPPTESVPLTALGLGTNGYIFTAPTANGRVYQLQYTDSLTNQNWAALPLQFGTGKIESFTDTNRFLAQRFYRLNRW